MNLDEGIQYCTKMAKDNADFKQIAKWLMELKDLRIYIGGEDYYLNEEDDSYDN